MNEKVLARARELRDVVKDAEPKLTGSLKRRAQTALRKANRDIPKSNRIGKQIKFQLETVKQAVERNGGDKNKAAEELGCSLRTIYTVLGRDDK